MIKIPFSLLRIVLVGLALSLPTAYARDIYIGTISIQDDRLVLKRCDVVQNTYELIDIAEGGPVSRFLAVHASDSGRWYAEVIGDYEDRSGQKTLRVLALENVKAEKGCHLLDALKKN